MYTSEQLKRLPRWAQDEINRLSRDNTALRQQMTSMQNEDSNTFWELFNGSRFQRVYVPNNTTFGIVLPDGCVFTAELMKTQNHIRVSCDNMQIQPGASNVVYVKGSK